MGKYRIGERKVAIKPISWDVAAYSDLIRGTGFICNEPGQIDIDGETKKTLNGPQSPRFGKLSNNDDENTSKWSCECGDFQGRIFEGEICPNCGKPVKEQEINIDMTAWIPFGKNKIVNPFYYQLLCKLIGQKVFPDIIDVKQRVDTDGHISELTEGDIKNPSSPFVGMGVTRFMERYDEVLDYFITKKKKKADELEELRKEKRKVFTSFCPVYHPILRPQSATTDTLYYTGIDKQINPLIRLAIGLEDAEEIEKPLILSKAQKRVNKMWDYNFSLINGKDGWIRDKLMGGSLNFSARNVIIPDPTLKENEIDISYRTFLILARDMILYYYMKANHVTLAKAFARWKEAFVFDHFIYEIMNHIIKKKRPKLLINRNPTLHYYSVLLMNIRQVKPKDTDLTLSVGLSILDGMNADFDGDILNQYLILTDELVHMFRKFNPTERMMIDRATGLLNNYFALSGGQLIDLYHYATL